MFKRVDYAVLSPETWLWCLHCYRFFQKKDLRRDITGKRQGCAFKECNGAGLGVDIYVWDNWQLTNGLAHWPKSTDELYNGARCTLYLKQRDVSDIGLHNVN